MVITIAVWLTVFSAAWGYGRAFYRQSGSLALEYNACRLYAGLLVLAFLLLAVSLFTNLSPLAGLVALAGGWVLAVWGRGRPKVSRIWFICIPLALFLSAREVDFYDTALYHQQAVKWLADYGLVTGIALIHDRLGLISSWFALAASLNHGVLSGRGAAIVGGLPFMVTVVTAIAILRNSLVQRSIALHSLTWLMFGVFLTAVSIAWNVGNSLSPDPIVWLLPAVIATVLTGTAGDSANRIGAAITIAALAILVKLSAAPVLGYCAALAVWHMVRNRQDRFRLTIYFAIIGGVLAVLIGASQKTSGCPMFPSPIGCLPVVWSVGRDAAAELQARIQQFAWSSRHWQALPLLLGSGIASLVAVRLNWRSPFVRHGLGLAWAGTLFLLFGGPSPRFGMGYFVWPIAIGCACALEELAKRFDQKITVLLNGIRLLRLRTAFTGAVLVASLTFAVSIAAFRDPRELLYPRRIASARGDTIHVVNQRIDSRRKLSLDSQQVGSLTVWSPTSSDQCWDAPLPCTPKLTFTGIALRNEARGFAAGFIKSAANEQARNEH